MKELQEFKQDKLEVSAVKPVKKELKLLGRLKPQKGHTCFQLNLSNGEITIAEFESVDIHYNYDHKKGDGVRKKIIVKENCVYVTALNKTNAVKHFKRLLSR